MQPVPPSSEPARVPPEGAADGSVVPPTARPNDDKAGLKLMIDLVPLAIFFVAFRFMGLIPATAILVVATLISVAASKILLGKISPMLIVSAVLVTVFGGLTIGLNDPRFIKMKPTIVNLLFAGALGFGLLTGRNFLKVVLGEALHLTAEGWRQLTYRWLGLFVGMAVLNEIVWRTWNTPETEHVWVNFKFPGMLVLTLVFTALQMPLLRRHAVMKTDV